MDSNDIGMLYSSEVYTLLGNHVPWRIQAFLARHWPVAYQWLRFGKSNANTQDHWNDAWARHGKDGYRATGILPEIRDSLVKIIPSGVKILDVGCGVGEIMTLLQERNKCVCSGMDIAPSAVAAVKAKGMEARVGILPDIPFSDASFEVLLCTEVLEHVTDAKSAVGSMYRVLQPGGLLVLTVPDGEVDMEEFHVHRFNEKSIRKMLTSTGFVVRRVELVNAELCPTLVIEAHRPA